MFRKLHRWFSLPLCLFIMLVLGTGVALQVEETLAIFDGEDERAAAPSQGSGHASLGDAEIAALVGSALALGRETEPDF